MPGEPESKLTLYKIALVREETLAEIALQIGLPEMILVGKGEKKRKGNYNSKILADGLEALLGWMYIDQGHDVVQNFVKKYVMNKLPEIKQKVNIKSYKTLLQEATQKLFKQLPVYEDEVAEVDQKGNPLKFVAKVFVN